ncbi:MAG TPA: ubiquitin-like domain-containing protein [Phototrophicaceae bacterium]|jgi:uncharacterized protein YabE (DUF348 family)|nr:ubiquitin-like domain-containing protein [Phototrophicaceae bacterium]
MPYTPFEPEPAVDDTRPTGIIHVPSLTDTQPIGDTPIGDTRPLTPVRASGTGRYGGWLLLTGFVGTIGVLALLITTLIIFAFQSTPGDPVSVQLQIDGHIYNVTTTASTVRDLLAEQAVQLMSDSVVVPDQDTRLTPGMTIAISIERTVTVTINGETSIFRTLYDNPLDILESIRFFPRPGDDIQVNGTHIGVTRLSDYPLPANDIVVKSALAISITQDGVTQQLETTEATVGDALHAAGITLYLGDRVTPDVNTPIEAGLTIIVEHSIPVTILVDGVSIDTRSGGETVADALRDAGVILNGLDYAVPPEMVSLTSDMQVRVVRITEEVQTDQQPIAYETVYQADAELELDQQQVLQVGVSGIEQHNTRIRYEDGIEVSRSDEGTTQTQPPVNQIVSYGTKVVLKTIDTPDGPREYWRKLSLYATSYSPKALGGDDRTSTGKKLTKGIVAIDPKLIPYDTQLYVPDYGIGLAADTGGPRRSRYWIDLGYDDDNFVSWSRPVDVYLLTPVPGNIPYILPPQ